MTVKEIFDAVLAFDESTVTAKTQAELDGGTDIGTILNDGLISAMDEVGERFSAGELFVPEMLMAAQAMKAGLKILKPHLSAGQSKSKGVVVIGTVKGDLHDIGKNLVSMMMEGAGFEVVDLGVDVDSEKFVKTAAEKKRRRDRPVGAADHDHAVHGEHGQGGQGGGHGDADDHRGCAGDPGLCRPDRRGRLQCRRPGGGQAGQAACWPEMEDR
jgi:hypothetical protein